MTAAKSSSSGGDGGAQRQQSAALPASSEQQPGASSTRQKRQRQGAEPQAATQPQQQAAAQQAAAPAPPQQAQQAPQQGQYLYEGKYGLPVVRQKLSYSQLLRAVRMGEVQEVHFFTTHDDATMVRRRWRLEGTLQLVPYSVPTAPTRSAAGGLGAAAHAFLQRGEGKRGPGSRAALRCTTPALHAWPAAVSRRLSTTPACRPTASAPADGGPLPCGAVRRHGGAEPHPRRRLQVRPCPASATRLCVALLQGSSHALLPGDAPDGPDGMRGRMPWWLAGRASALKRCHAEAAQPSRRCHRRCTADDRLMPDTCWKLRCFFLL